mmetsp:Transcript_8957/g.19006  ORF Transcript_8957/g.19006 Transcript_8957/m.19006 type:complete len:308 (-) Transcript_8957:116-1039(-)
MSGALDAVNSPVRAGYLDAHAASSAPAGAMNVAATTGWAPSTPRGGVYGTVAYNNTTAGAAPFVPPQPPSLLAANGAALSALHASYSRQTILQDISGREIVADADIYPIPSSPSSASLAPQQVHGDARLLYACWYLQLSRFRFLIESRAVHINTMFSFGSSNENVLHWLLRGEMPSGFRYTSGRLYQSVIDDMISVVVQTPGADLRSWDAGACAPIVRAARNGMSGPFLLLLAAGVMDDCGEYEWDVVLNAIDASAGGGDVKRKMRTGAMQRCHAVFERKDAEVYEQPKRKRTRIMPCQCRCCQYSR